MMINSTYFSIFLVLISHLCLAQSHYIGLSAGAHYAETDFYISKPGQDYGLEYTTKIRFATGIEYAYYFQDKNSWYTKLAVDYTDRSHTIQQAVDGKVQPFSRFKYNATYIDVSVGVGKKFDISRRLNASIAILPGVGLPLLKEIDYAGVPYRIYENNLDNYLPFTEIRTDVERIIFSNRNHAWSIGLSLFNRFYFKPLYTLEYNENIWPYWSGGLALKLGFHVE